MKQPNQEQRERFILEVILPQHQQLIAADSFFAIKDEDSKYVLCSNKMANWLGLTDGFAIAGKKIADFNQFSQSVIEDSYNTDKMVKTYQKPIEEIQIIGNNQPVIINKVPLFYPDGSFFGIRETIRKFELIYPFQVMSHMLGGCDNLPAVQAEAINMQISEEEKSVLFLLLSGHGRAYIAELMKVNISKVSRIISELCNKFGVITHHQERLINYVIHRGIFRFVPELIMKRLRASINEY